MRILQRILANVLLDPRHGLGQVPFNEEIDYRGFRVKMTPSQFLKLAYPLDTENERDTIDYIKQHLNKGKPLGQPWLNVRYDPKGKKPPIIIDHDGRHRMQAIKELYGDIPIEVHIFPTDGLRARHITPAMKDQLRNIVIPQRIKLANKPTKPLSGPHFEL